MFIEKVVCSSGVFGVVKLFSSCIKCTPIKGFKQDKKEKVVCSRGVPGVVKLFSSCAGCTPTKG